MSDIAILKQMIKQDMTVSLTERKEKTHSKYSVTLTENQNNYSVIIDGIPEPDEVIIIRADNFKTSREVFNGTKGECKRADFVIIADTFTEKIILFIEMKRNKDDKKDIAKQLYGAQCFIAYCQEIGKTFWHQHKFLEAYQYHFVTIGRIPISKTKTRADTANRTRTQTHSIPENMLIINGKNYLQFYHLI